jgi:ethanolamine ammonia-lyase small subunit
MTDQLPVSLDGVVDARDEVADLTPARLFLGRSGTSYKTSTQLRLRADHAFAKDALQESLSLETSPLRELVEQFDLFELSTQATSHDEYLARPDKGRRLSSDSMNVLKERCLIGSDVQVVIGDGLSPLAVRAQVPSLLAPLLAAIEAHGWTTGAPAFVRHCRVGVMNDIGEATDAQNVVLLIGERPGLATAESLSAYLAHRPRNGDTDAQRNLVSNIHEAGVDAADAVRRIIGLLESFRLQGRSGFMVKEAGQVTSLPSVTDR